MPTEVINVKKAPKGWKEDPQYVDVRRMRNGRVNPNPSLPGGLGNPYKLTDGDYTRTEVIELFRGWSEARLKTDPDYRKAVRSLSGKTLICVCAPLSCHGEVLAELADRLASGVQEEPQPPIPTPLGATTVLEDQEHE